MSDDAGPSQAIPLRKLAESAPPSEDSQHPIVTRDRDRHGRPFISWRVPNGPCRCAWIERTHGQPGDARFLFSVQTDTIDGNPIGEPISAPVYHDMADLETLLAYVWASLEPRR
jgi:hypothetical protein